MNQESFGINQQANRITDQHERDNHQYRRQGKQDQAQPLHIIMDYLHHILSVKQLRDRRIVSNVLLYHLEAIGVGVLRIYTRLIL